MPSASRRDIRNGGRSISPRRSKAGRDFPRRRPGSAAPRPRTKQRRRAALTSSLRTPSPRAAFPSRRSTAPNCSALFSPGKRQRLPTDDRGVNARSKVFALEGAMDEPELSPSDQIARPRSLTERLKAEAAIGHGPQIEAASFMAERFAPELPPHATHDAGLTMQGGQVPGAGPAFAPPRERGRRASRVLPGAFL